MPPAAWTLLGIAVALLAGVFKYLFDLNREVGNVKTIIENADLKNMRTQVDRLMFRQEAQDERVAKTIHSPHHSGPGGRDELVERLIKQPKAMSKNDLCEVIGLLEEEERTAEAGLKRYYAGLLVDRAKAELSERSQHA
jgi:hypothetical protein